MPSQTILAAGALVTLLPSWLGLLGAWHWQLDLLAHFRWQYLVVSAGALAWGLWRRQRVVLIAALATMALNAALIGRLAWPVESGATLARDFSLRVLSLNVLTSNSDHRAVLEHVLAADADIVFLMEVDRTWLDALAPLHAAYPHRLTQPRADNFGLALYSRVPLHDARIVELGNSGLPSVIAGIRHQRRELLLLGTHPVPPMGARNAGRRDRQLAAVAALVAEAREPVLLVGDLNATPWSSGLRLLTDARLNFGSHDPPWTPTWRREGPFAIPIDHALCTAPLVITRRSVGPDLGSDHRPLLVTVGWAQQG